MEILKKKIQIILNLYKSGKLSKAEMLCKSLIKSNPKIVYLYNTLGLILTARKKKDQAIFWFEEGLKIQPRYAMIYNNLGTVYKSMNNLKKAEYYYNKSIELDNKIPDSQNNLGNLYLSMNKFLDAIDCYKKAIKINQKFVIAHHNLGLAYKAIGEFKSATKHLSEATNLNPYFYHSHKALSQIINYNKKTIHLSELKKLYNDSKFNELGKMELSFALGKAFEDIGKFHEAFKLYNEANLIRKKNINFSLKDEKKEFINIKKVFNREIFNRFSKFANLSDKVIFILGMPRSGTSLIEQIISSHSKVFGGGELNFMIDLVKKHFKNGSVKTDFGNICNLKETELKNLAQEYLDNLNNISKDSFRITDKLPINFKWIGLIKLILPNSKIIHCVRNSRDTCLSIFKINFPNPSLGYAYDLNDLTEFYNLYFDLMRYWKEILPNFIHDIEYEKIVKKPDREIRNLIKVCNLDWEDNCLKFYKNKRPIKTASDTQARKRIYKTSINSWKNFEIDLKDSFNKLPN